MPFFLYQTLDNRELSNKREIMTRKSTYTIQNGFDGDEDDGMTFGQCLWRVLLVLFTLGLIGVGVAVMTLGNFRHQGSRELTSQIK